MLKIVNKWIIDSLAKNPGLRVPGAFDLFEMGLRAVLGQQITVKAATTLGGRFTAAFGEPYATPFAELTHIAPEAAIVAQAQADSIASLGIISARARDPEGQMTNERHQQARDCAGS